MSPMFAKEGLGRLHDVLAGHVDAGAAPGLVTAVSRRGETHVDVIGATSVGGGSPVTTDTLFRISSMTKPITAVATLVLGITGVVPPFVDLHKAA